MEQYFNDKHQDSTCFRWEFGKNHSALSELAIVFKTQDKRVYFLEIRNILKIWTLKWITSFKYKIYKSEISNHSLLHSGSSIVNNTDILKLWLKMQSETFNRIRIYNWMELLKDHGELIADSGLEAHISWKNFKIRSKSQ
jgi:hypothetical protein